MDQQRKALQETGVRSLSLSAAAQKREGERDLATNCALRRATNEHLH